MRSEDARERGRARRVLLELDRRETMRRLARRAARRWIDLESALFLLGSMDRPRLDSRPYTRALDAMGEAVRRIADREPSGISRALALVTYLSGELGFTGDQEDYLHPDNVHLHRVIERRRGIPLTLVAVYLAVARRAGVRATAVPLPGHVMLRVHADGGPADSPGATNRAVLVDPFHGGKLRTRRECQEYLRRHGVEVGAEWFRDADDTELFQRQVRNLERSASQRGVRGLSRDLGVVAEILERSRARRFPAVAGRT
jgi:regulator of sirC expression with transglutaminase-like and TPR domain